MVAVLLKMLRQRNDIRMLRTEVRMVACDSDRVGPESRHQTRARRIANGLLTIRSLKQSAGIRKPVNIGAVNVRTAVARKFRPKIIHCDKQYVGRRRVYVYG